MRMSIGGPNGDLLAVTSEEGCVCIFSIKKKEIIGKIKGLSGKTVNCVKWKH
jgi:WD40 repeat protein